MCHHTSRKKLRLPIIIITLFLSLSIQSCGSSTENLSDFQREETSSIIQDTNTSPVSDDSGTITESPKINSIMESCQTSQLTENHTLPTESETEFDAPSSAKTLHVDASRLTDSEGNPVQLRGISTHGLAWFPDYINEDCFHQLKEEWGINVIRLAMYTAEYNGYCTGGDQSYLKELIHNGVEYATAADMYVIIDWHILSDGNPNTYKKEAKIFFAEMAERYAGYDNIMYALHFYAATHTDSLRNTMISATEAGLPIFVSEYGICDASGNGAIDEYQAARWINTMDEYGVSYVAWNLSNKEETSAILSSKCGKTSGFTEDDLSPSGKWLYQMLTAKNPEPFLR